MGQSRPSYYYKPLLHHFQTEPPTKYFSVDFIVFMCSGWTAQLPLCPLVKARVDAIRAAEQVLSSWEPYSLLSVTASPGDQDSSSFLDWCYVYLVCFLFETVSLYTFPPNTHTHLAWNSLSRPVWPRTRRSTSLCSPSSGITDVRPISSLTL